MTDVDRSRNWKMITRRQVTNRVIGTNDVFVNGDNIYAGSANSCQTGRLSGVNYSSFSILKLLLKY